MTAFMVTIRCFGHIVVREVEAQDAFEAERRAREQAGLEVTVTAQVNVEEQVRLANEAVEAEEEKTPGVYGSLGGGIVIRYKDDHVFLD